MTANGPQHVAVIGAGIIGAAVAHALLEDGRRVTLIDPGPPGGEQAASFGNGAFISPASIIPMSVPGLWRKVPGYLLDRNGPLTIRWRHLPRLAPWLIRFLLAGATEARLRRTSARLATLLGDAPERHLALAAAIGRPDLILQHGLTYAYPDRAAFEAEALSWGIRRDNGLEWRELEAQDLQAHEPALSPDYRFAAVVDRGAYCLDPGGYVAALAQAAAQRGARLLSTRVTGFRRDGARLQALETEAGDLDCDAAVLAAGIGSGTLARSLGDAVPMVSERGYHVQIPGAEGGPRHPVMPSDGKMANTPVAGGLRASGQVELASTGAAPDWRRAEVLLANLRRTWPQLRYDPAEVRRWQGHRPSPPDGLPVLGRSRACPDVMLAFGHGHTGLAAAPMTAAIIAALLADRQPPIPVEPFRPARFR